MPASPDPSGHPGLLDPLADEHAVLLELLGEDGVQEGVGAAVEGQHEDGEHFGLLQGDEVGAGHGRQREEGDRGPADEVGDHQEGHALGDPGVVRVPGLGLGGT